MNITRNIFSGGRNTDTDPQILQPNQYTEAHNVELVGNGKFFSLQNVNGTNFLLEIEPDPDVVVLGSFPNKYLINGSQVIPVTVPNLSTWTQQFELSATSWGLSATPTINLNLLPQSRHIRAPLASIPGVVYTLNYSFTVSSLTGTATLDIGFITGASVSTAFTSFSSVSLSSGANTGSVSVTGDGSAEIAVRIRTTGTVSGTLLSVTADPITTETDAINECITIFTASPSDVFKIWCYNVETGVLYELYEESIISDYLTDSRVVDAKNYPENGVDYLYFTDNYNELRYLKCEIPDPYSANFLSAYDLSLLRKGANGSVTMSDIDSGGTLLSGTYQFAYRMVDPTGKRFTKWSSLSNPIHVYDSENTTNSEPVRSGVGLVTNRKITLSVTPASEELDNFEYYQLAVVENISVTSPTVASLLEITPISGPSDTFEYKSNSKIGTIPLTDITVDLAQIETAKTLSVKENRLFAANIKYTELEFDRGTPEVTTGSIIVEGLPTHTDAYANDEFSSEFIGYWRDEVYRFCAIYTDENGNKRIQPLNFDGKISGNEITAGLPDIKFPDRSVSNTYSLFGSSARINALGLQIEGLVNHPSWARSVEIGVVKRKKNILFQSPLIPMSTVSGVGATSDYPTRYFNGSSYVTVANAQPMTAGDVLLPKNLYWPELRDIKQNGVPYSPSGFFAPSTAAKAASEVKLVRNDEYSYAALFPSQSMYSADNTFTNSFQYTGGEKVDIVDYALLRVDATEFTSPDVKGSFLDGDFIKTSISTNFYALAENQYYFDSTYVGKTISASLKNIPITDYEFFDNFGSGASVGGNSVLDYAALQTQGISFWQYKPNVQRMGVVQLGNTLSEGQIVFKAGTLNAVGNNTLVVSGQTHRYDPDLQLSNKYITEYSGFSNKSTYISAVPIVNVKLGIGDDRYGDIDAQHEFISTGAKHTFTPAEIATLQAGGVVSVDLDVWGGDCFIGSHLFKVADSAYSVTNQGKNQTPQVLDGESLQTRKWGSIYRYEQSGSNPVLCIPVSVQNAGQYVQVILESEYNGDVRDVETIGIDGSVNNIPRYLNDTEASIRTPLTYKYNPNLSKQNDQKIYLPKPRFGFEQYQFQARIVYTDIKIYNSDQAGFDIIRVADFYDLEESRYGITKLAVAGDAMYAIQERGIIYVPTGERQIEQTDAGTLSVRSGDVIGRVLTVDAARGSQHLRGIVETGGTVYIPDNLNKGVYVLSGQELRAITENNDSEFRSMFYERIGERYLIGVYNPVRRQYFLADNLNNKCQVFNEQLGVWVGNHEFTGFQGGNYTYQELYLFGKPSDTLGVYLMYAGDVNQLFGETVVPRVTLAVNPDGEISKTFDNMMFASTQRLSSLDLTVSREIEVGDQTVSGISLDVQPVEGNYRVKTLLDSANARLRGLKMMATVKWKNIKAALTAIETKYRPSSRTPF